MEKGQEWYEYVSRHGEWRMDKREDLKWEFSESAVLRYVEQSDSRPLELATQYIKTITSFENPEVEGVEISGTFVTKSVWWGKVQDFNGQDAFRLYHLMVDEAVSGGDSARIIEKGCRYNVTYTFYYRQSSIITPTQSTSGVSYKIIGITRDPDTGLFSYILEKRERMVQTTGVYQSADDRLKGIERQDFTGVRDGDKDEDGAAVALWPVEWDTEGVTVTEERSKNEDCTVDIRQVRVTAKAVTDARRSVRKDARRLVETAIDRNQAAAVIAAVEAAEGVITERSADVNDDGSYNNTEQVTAEQALSEGRKVVSDDDEKSVTETLNENQSAAGALPVPAVAGTETEIENSKTDGFLFNVRTRVTVWKKWLSQIVEAVRTVYESKNGVTHKALTEAEKDAYISGLSAGGGHSYSWKVTKRADGKFDLTLWDNGENTVETARAGSSVTAFNSRSWTESVEAAQADAVIAVTGGVISSVTSEQQAGGRWRNRADADAAVACSDSGKNVEVFPWGKRVKQDGRNISAKPDDATAAGTASHYEMNDHEWYMTSVWTWVLTGFADVQQSKSVSIRGLFKYTDVKVWNASAELAYETAQTPGQILVNENITNERGGTDTVQRKIEATKEVHAYTVPNATGDVYVLRYTNHTASEEAALIAALSGNNINQVSFGNMNEFGLYDGVITTKALDSTWKTIYQIDETGLTEETQPRIVKRSDGLKTVTYQLTYDIKLDWNVAAGTAAYSGAKWGSWFRNLGGGWYYYKKVTNVKIKEEDYTPNTSYQEV